MSREIVGTETPNFAAKPVWSDARSGSGGLGLGDGAQSQGILVKHLGGASSWERLSPHDRIFKVSSARLFTIKRSIEWCWATRAWAPNEMPEQETALIDGRLPSANTPAATTGPNWPTFLKFADRYIKVKPADGTRSEAPPTNEGVPCLTQRARLTKGSPRDRCISSHPAHSACSARHCNALTGNALQPSYSRGRD